MIMVGHCFCSACLEIANMAECEPVILVPDCAVTKRCN